MNYTVVWIQSAEDGLASAWLAAPDRTAVTNAAYRLEQAIARNPFAVGESRNASVNRTAIDHPLGIEFEIIEDDKLVRVIRAWAVG